MDFVMRLQDRAIAVIGRFPWIGWAAWLVFCVVALLRTHPRRFGSTFQAYLTAAHSFWNGQPIYDMSVLGEYLYWPVSLLALGPLPMLSPVVAAAIATAIVSVLMSVASYALLSALLPEHPRRDVINLTGILLMIIIPACWFNFKYVQAQIGMTAFMMIAAAAMARRHWLLACFWLFLSVIVKPLSLVMLLLCGATQPRMRIGLIVALIAALALPFAFADVHYVAGEYRNWIIKLQQLVSVAPGEWIYQADFATMLDTIGITLPHLVQTGIRLAAALFILAMVWRVARLQNRAVFAVAVTLFAGCYITLFGPRNEFLSFLVLAPTVAALGLVLLTHDPRNQRAWLLILAALLLGFDGPLAVDRFVKPLVTFILLGWMIWLTIEPQRWASLLAPVRPNPGAQPGLAVSPA